VSSYRIVVLLFFSVVVFAIHLDNEFFAQTHKIPQKLLSTPLSFGEG
jgi:hypothetical protein